MLVRCQEPEVYQANSNGKVASPSKPVKTIGNGDRVLITTNTIWSSDTIYLLNGEVIVRNASLTIEPGTVIKGTKDTTPIDQDILNSVLLIDVNAQIFAQGMPNNPIVFTSNEPPGQRNPGDWGGVVLLGPDGINQSSAYIEGIEDPLLYGGLGDRRSSGSGIMEYVRIEFAGTILRDGNETNGLTLAGVDANTMINHIQVSRSNDDGFEFFGGTVNAQFLVSWQCRDDDFDVDFGHTGVIQYAVSRRNNDFVSAESNGIESDNSGLATLESPLDSTILKTNTLFANITFVGPGQFNSDGSEIDDTFPLVFNAGVLKRRNSATSLFNSIIASWRLGINLRDQNTLSNILNDQSRLVGNSVGLPSASDWSIRFQNGSIPVVFFIFGEGNNIEAKPSIQDLKSTAFATGTHTPNGTNPAGTPDFTLTLGSVNLNNAEILPMDAINRGMVQESFRGAFGPGGLVTGGNWNFSSGWLEFDPQNTVYH